MKRTLVVLGILVVAAGLGWALFAWVPGLIAPRQATGPIPGTSGAGSEGPVTSQPPGERQAASRPYKARVASGVK